MAIGSVLQRGTFVIAYDTTGRQLCTVLAQAGLVGYTGSSFSIRTPGGFVVTYNERGEQISSQLGWPN